MFGVNENEEEYSSSVPVDVQNILNKCLGEMIISYKHPETESQKNMNSELDPTVKTFLDLLYIKLDAQTIPNLFRQEGTPTCNLLSNMLIHHKLRSMFDFEKAVVREWELLNKEGHDNLKWNFRVIDKVAGQGTAVETVFILKENGVFRGAKRRLKFSNPDDLTRRMNKSLKLDDHMSGLMSDLRMNDTGSKDVSKGIRRENVAFNVSTSGCGWHGSRKTPPKEMPAGVYKGQGSGKSADGKKLTLKKGMDKGGEENVVTPTPKGNVYKGQGKCRLDRFGKKVCTPVLETPSRLRCSLGTPKTPKASRRARVSEVGKNQSSMNKFITCSPRVGRGSMSTGKASDVRRRAIYNQNVRCQVDFL